MRMDALRELLRDLKQQGLGRGNFLGLLNVLIGRRVHRTDGTLVSAGCSWRTAAGYLKRVRWPKDAVRELELDPAMLHPRDRVRYWFQAISQASVDSQQAVQAGDRFAEALARAGYVIAPGPKSASQSPESGLPV